tara:strand:- start:5296 stop:6411 length:1116 start_codon:yes stop_codon:yes gene_type:complete
LIRVFEPRLSISDKVSVLRGLLKNNISGTSPSVSKFEDDLANYFNRAYAVTVSNGSVALDLALQNANLKKGDEIIVPSFTIISCLSAILRTQATPIFCDVDANSWNMTKELVEEKITNKTKAILMVHLYGLAAEASKIENLCNKNNILLIEDAAESHGQVENSKKCGSFGSISTMSFYANKHITTGEGGVLLTNDIDVYKKTQQMRNLDFNNKKRFVHNNLYWNYRLGGLQAALGISQLKNLTKTIDQKINQGKYYQDLLKKHENKLSTQLDSWNGMQNHYWVFGILLKKADIRDKVMEDLFEKGIETRPFFWPLHLQPLLPKEYMPNDLNLNISEDLGKNGFYIPIGNHISKNDQKQIVDHMIDSIEKYE